MPDLCQVPSILHSLSTGNLVSQSLRPHMRVRSPSRPHPQFGMVHSSNVRRSRDFMFEICRDVRSSVRGLRSTPEHDTLVNSTAASLKCIVVFSVINPLDLHFLEIDWRAYDRISISAYSVLSLRLTGGRGRQRCACINK